MKLIKRLLPVFLTMALVLSVSAFAAGSDKQVTIEDSKDGYITISDVTSEKQVGNQTVYYASSPVKVAFYGSDIARERIDYLPDAKVDNSEIDEGENYSEVTFDVADYKYYGDDTVYSKITQPVTDECTYVSGNYVTLKNAGVYSVIGSPAAAYGSSFYIVTSNGSSNASVTIGDGITTIPTSSKVLVNGSSVSFDAYTIDENNYFKLRDLAKVLNGTDKQFEVSWDSTNKAINLESGSAYTAVGGELAAGDGTIKSAELNTSKIYKDGTEVSLTAYTINGNNYFKLRDIGKAFNFGVGWDSASNTISIDTSTGYSE